MKYRDPKLFPLRPAGEHPLRRLLPGPDRPHRRVPQRRARVHRRSRCRGHRPCRDPGAPQGLRAMTATSPPALPPPAGTSQRRAPADSPARQRGAQLDDALADLIGRAPTPTAEPSKPPRSGRPPRPAARPSPTTKAPPAHGSPPTTASCRRSRPVLSPACPAPSSSSTPQRGAARSTPAGATRQSPNTPRRAGRCAPRPRAARTWSSTTRSSRSSPSSGRSRPAVVVLRLGPPRHVRQADRPSWTGPTTRGSLRIPFGPKSRAAHAPVLGGPRQRHRRALAEVPAVPEGEGTPPVAPVASSPGEEDVLGVARPARAARWEDRHPCRALRAVRGPQPPGRSTARSSC